MTYPPQEPLPYPQGGYPGGHPPGYGGGWGPPPQRPIYIDGQPLGSPPPQGPRGNTPLVVTAIAVLIAALVFVGALVWKMGSDSDTASGPATTSTTASSAVPAVPPSTSASSTTPSTPSTPLASTCDEHGAGPGPQTPAGWSTVNTPRGLVYDVPPGWDVLSCSTLTGWEKACDDGPFGYCPIRMMSGAAKLPNPTCESGSHAVTGAPGASNADDISEAVRLESTLVADIYTEDDVVPNVTLSAPRHLTIGDTAAVEIVATVTGVGPGECSESPGALHVMVATTVPDQPGCVLFVISMNQGGTGDPDPALAGQLIDTLRIAD